MSNDWMLDVLDDLRRFAELNDLPRLSRELKRTAGVARAELRPGASQGTVRDEWPGRAVSGAAVEGENA